MKTLLEARKEAKLSQVELAEKCGLSQFTITQIETGKVSPQPDTRKRIENVLGRIDWLNTIGLHTQKSGEMTSWESVDQIYRRALREIRGLSNVERLEFIKVAQHYLKQFKKEYTHKIK